MKAPQVESKSIKRVGAIKRKAISISPEGLIKTGVLQPGQSLPLMIQPAVDGVSLVAWGATNREFIEANLYRHGAILFRNFGMSTAIDLEHLILSVSGSLLDYGDQTSPRHKVSGNIYTSTDHPADQFIFLHNENSYSRVWPLKIFFFCVTPAQQGGETPIADVRKVFQRIDPKIRERFMEKRWMLVRNFGEVFGLSWQTVFQTTDRSAVEEFCHKADIEVEWRGGDSLRTRQVREAVATHPRTGETVWFNHATFFHVSSLESSMREALIVEFNEEDLPYNTYYGDGSRIEPSVLEELRDAYRHEQISFAWQRGDVLMLDNMLTAHGRAPYEGPRKVLVGMSEPFETKGSET
jgi:alpha-ketoglutarate-dependent taurine dioxygenase